MTRESNKYLNTHHKHVVDTLLTGSVVLQLCYNCRSASLDVEPLYTFRCHTGPVLCLAMSASGEQCFSGGIDGAIHCWTLPSANIDPYDSYGK